MKKNPLNQAISKELGEWYQGSKTSRVGVGERLKLTAVESNAQLEMFPRSVWNGTLFRTLE